MLSQVSFSKDKRAISVMVGYILLISIAIVMGGIVYAWLKTYVPKDTVDCPDGVSVTIEDITCETQGIYKNINLTLKNNGRFSIDSFYIRGATSPDQEIAVKDLSGFLAGQSSKGMILYPLAPGASKDFEIKTIDGEIYHIEILPTVEEGKDYITCGNAKIKELVSCQ